MRFSVERDAMQREIPQVILRMTGSDAVVAMHGRIMDAMAVLGALRERELTSIAQRAQAELYPSERTTVQGVAFAEAKVAFERYELAMTTLVFAPREVTRATVLGCGEATLTACAAAMPKTKGN